HQSFGFFLGARFGFVNCTSPRLLLVVRAVVGLLLRSELRYEQPDRENAAKYNEKTPRIHKRLTFESPFRTRTEYTLRTYGSHVGFIDFHRHRTHDRLNGNHQA